MTDKPDRDRFDIEDAPGPRDDQPEDKTPESLGIAWGFVISLLSASMVAIFIFQNNETIPVRFLWLDFSVSLWLVIMAVVLFTLIADQLVSLSWRRRKREKIARKAARS